MSVLKHRQCIKVDWQVTQGGGGGVLKKQTSGALLVIFISQFVSFDSAPTLGHRKKLVKEVSGYLVDNFSKDQMLN